MNANSENVPGRAIFSKIQISAFLEGKARFRKPVVSSFAKGGEIKLRELVRQERRITTEILKLIHLADERKLYLDRGFPSLFEW